VRIAVDPSRDLPSLDDLRTLDPDAWEALYLVARPVLWRFARTRLATADQVEDAVSETLVRAMSAMARYEQGASGIVGWLLGIERNVLMEMYRAGAKSRATTGLREPDAAGPADVLVATDEARAVRDAFAELLPDEQELLGLRVVARLDAETTGRVLGKRPGAVRMAQARALRRLRVMLEEGET
jgi:RNA polymerase sigma-70 factor (ECF subfamily)